jgi:hypothetical protein
MAIKFSQAQRLFTGLPAPAAGDKYWAYDTNLLYMTYDGTNWVLYLTLG